MMTSTDYKVNTNIGNGWDILRRLTSIRRVSLQLCGRWICIKTARCLHVSSMYGIQSSKSSSRRTLSRRTGRKRCDTFLTPQSCYNTLNMITYWLGWHVLSIGDKYTTDCILGCHCNLKIRFLRKNLDTFLFLNIRCGRSESRKPYQLHIMYILSILIMFNPFHKSKTWCRQLFSWSGSLRRPITLVLTIFN